MEYEDEVDLLALVVTDGEEGEGRACVKLHDNSSGVLLKTIPLEQAWDVVRGQISLWQRILGLGIVLVKPFTLFSFFFIITDIPE